MDHETDVLAQAQAGNLPAFEALYLAHHAALYRYVYAELLEDGQAQAMTQETFVRAWQHLRRIRNEEHFAHWLTWNARKHMPKRATPEPAKPGKGPQTTGEERTLRFRQTLAGLPEPQRAVFILREWEGLNYEEIADRMHMGEGTVISRLTRARQTLLETTPAKTP